MGQVIHNTLWTLQTTSGDTSIHHYAPLVEELSENSIKFHYYAQIYMYALDQIYQIVHSELFGMLVKICLENGAQHCIIFYSVHELWKKKT